MFAGRNQRPGRPAFRGSSTRFRQIFDPVRNHGRRLCPKRAL